MNRTMTEAERILDLLGETHRVPCWDIPYADCDSCDYELHEAWDRIAEGEYAIITKNDFGYAMDNIGAWEVEEHDLMEIGWRPAHAIVDEWWSGLHRLNDDGTFKHKSLIERHFGKGK